MLCCDPESAHDIYRITESHCDFLFFRKYSFFSSDQTDKLVLQGVEITKAASKSSLVLQETNLYLKQVLLELALGCQHEKCDKDFVLLSMFRILDTKMYH